MATKTPRPPDFDLDDLINGLDPDQDLKTSSNRRWGLILLSVIAIIALIGAGLWFLNSNSEEDATTSNQLLGPIETAESFGWEELDSVCLNNRIIGAAPLKGICGPTWEKIFTQITEFIPGPIETVTVTETQTVFRPGNRVYLAPRDPLVQEGIAGDVFINRTNGNLYRKIENAWNLSANISVERVVTEVETVTVTETVYVQGGSGQGSANLGACDDNVDVSAKPAYKATKGWYVSEVTFSDIAAGCNGQTLMIELLDSSDATLVEGEKAISGSTLTFTCVTDSNGFCTTGGDLTTPVGVTQLSSAATKIVFAIYD